MRVTYDSVFELAQAAIRCNNTAEKGKCEYCPFYDGCTIDEQENRSTLCAEIDK